MSSNPIEIEIDAREAKLILNYGYPFPAEEKSFEAVKDKSGWHKIKVDGYWLEIIIGDLCRSMKEVKSDDLLEELDALCDSLELMLKRG